VSRVLLFIYKLFLILKRIVLKTRVNISLRRRTLKKRLVARKVARNATNTRFKIILKVFIKRHTSISTSELILE
jgi:hypothetical protein